MRYRPLFASTAYVPCGRGAMRRCSVRCRLGGSPGARGPSESAGGHDGTEIRMRARSDRRATRPVSGARMAARSRRPIPRRHGAVRERRAARGGPGSPRGPRVSPRRKRCVGRDATSIGRVGSPTRARRSEEFERHDRRAWSNAPFAAGGSDVGEAVDEGCVDRRRVKSAWCRTASAESVDAWPRRQ